ADAEPGDQAQPGQFSEIGRPGGDEREYPEQQIAEDKRRLAAVAVADPAENLRAEQNADIARAQNEAERFWLNVPLSDEARRGKGDSADVVAVDHGDEDRPDNQL